MGDIRRAVGSPMRGSLMFNSHFPSGNLDRAVQIASYEYDLYLRADSENDKYRHWFYFSVANANSKDQVRVGPGIYRGIQRVIFNVRGLTKKNTLYRQGMAPVVRSSSRPQWTRIPSRHCQYTQDEGGVNPALSFAFAFDRPGDVYYFAYCYPYTYSDLTDLLNSCSRLAPVGFRRDTLCTSIEGRKVEVVTITDGQVPANSRLPVVVVTARVHPGESPSSYVVEGLIKYLICNDQIAVHLRQHAIFKIVPMLNPDGVELGNYRCCSLGFDLNRCWNRPTDWNQPTIKGVKDLVCRLARQGTLAYYIDVHAHSCEFNCFLYGNQLKVTDLSGLRYQKLLPCAMAEVAKDFSKKNSQNNSDAKKAGTARRYTLWTDMSPEGYRTLGTLTVLPERCYTLETSFYGYRHEGQSGLVSLYTQDDYMKIGESLAKALHLCLEELS